MGFSGCRKQRWSPKCWHFLFRSPFSLAKQEVSAFCCLFLIDPCLFHRKGVSGNTEHNGEVQNGFTSCFDYQTGSASSFLPFLYRLICAIFIPRGFSGYRIQRLSPKCCHFLFCSPNRKCQHFRACNWLIRAVFSGRGLLGMRNTMVKPEMSSLPVLLARQEVQALFCL